MACTISGSRLAMIGCLVICAGGLSSAFDNTTDKYLSMEEDRLMRGRFLGARKKPRFLSFQTIDNEISVEMQLSVPFLTIPVKKTMDTASGMLSNFPSANVNIAALGLAGAVVVSSVFLIPSIFRLMSADQQHWGNDNVARSDNMSPLARIEQALGANGLPAGACTQRALCTLVKRAAETPAPNSSDKIVDGLASNDWLLGMLQSTILSEAITTGYGPEDCSAKYHQCKINHVALQNVVKAFSSKIFN